MVVDHLGDADVVVEVGKQNASFGKVLRVAHRRLEVVVRISASSGTSAAAAAAATEAIAGRGGSGGGGRGGHAVIVSDFAFEAMNITGRFQNCTTRWGHRRFTTAIVIVALGTFATTSFGAPRTGMMTQGVMTGVQPTVIFQRRAVRMTTTTNGSGSGSRPLTPMVVVLTWRRPLVVLMLVMMLLDVMIGWVVTQPHVAAGRHGVRKPLKLGHRRR